ncbi:S-adenosyl-L-methionine-dependent methyltransferase, partial [Ochromonadaceae sp. CCMP2298]
VSPLSQPGLSDLTADVDFSLCSAAAASKGAKVALLTQGEFLMRMGIVPRVEALLELESTTDEQAAALVSSLKYLVQGEHMGARFKVLAVAAPSLGVTGFDSA